MAIFGFVWPLSNLVESFVDNSFKRKVKPKVGSVVYCELAFGIGEHSGIYLGRNRIAHLDGSGLIESASSSKFLDRLGGFNSAISIYVSCHGGRSVGNKEYAERARNYIGGKRDYNVILDNCHQFTSGCITGDFENADNFMWMLKHTTSKSLDVNNWLVWER